jgi:hypothetical protein
MKTLVVLSAALAISLACVGTASAQGLVSVTTTTDGFGNQKTSPSAEIPTAVLQSRHPPPMPSAFGDLH